jgi:hypothetical protein
MSPDNENHDPGGYTGEGFLSRWSRRKRREDEPKAVADAPAQPPLLAEAEADPRLHDPRPRDPETGEIIDEEHVSTLPPVETLKPGDDLSGFMRKGVPEALRRQALRTMWTTDPAIRDFVSPALDYAHDYNTPGAVVGFGPLGDDDAIKAQAMVERMFSAPEQPASNPAEKSAEKPADGVGDAASGEDCAEPAATAADDGGDIASHQPDNAASTSVRRSFAAAQHDSTDLAAPNVPGLDNAALDSPKQRSELAKPAHKAMLQRENTVDPNVAAGGPALGASMEARPPRRRGGGATPV